MCKLKKVICIFLLMLVASFSMGITRVENSEKSKIFKNIYIENIDVSGLTKKDALKKVSEFYIPKDIKVKYKEKTWIINKDKINLIYNIDNACKSAREYTRTKDTLLNLKRITNLVFKENHKIQLKATYDESKLSEEIDKIRKTIDKKEVNATISIKDNCQIITTDSKEGIELDTIKLKEYIYHMINKKQIADINLPIKIINPKINSDDVKSVNAVLGQYSTSFNNSSTRGCNIYIAGESTNDILVMPGEIFSYNKSTGARTWSNGYKSAKVIVGGRYVNGEGGGVCQVSTTIYNAALLSNMEIVEVHNHTYPSKYAPKGRDAAVSYGYIDLKFKNPYNHPIYIKNIVKNGAITSKIYGCNDDRQKLYIKTDEKYNKEKIYVNTYRVYLDVNNNKQKEELVSKSMYKVKSQ